MDTSLLIAIIGVLPETIIVTLAIVAGIRYRKRIARIVDERVASFTLFGLRVDLRPGDLAKVVADRAPEVKLGDLALAAVSERVTGRARRLGSRLAGRTVLWVDDAPFGNRHERRLLRQMGLFVESVSNNDEALALLADPEDHIDLVISDIRRGADRAGLILLDELRTARTAVPLIFYVGRVSPDRPIPPGAFGITARPDELLDLVMDAMERSS